MRGASEVIKAVSPTPPRMARAVDGWRHFRRRRTLRMRAVVFAGGCVRGRWRPGEAADGCGGFGRRPRAVGGGRRRRLRPAAGGGHWRACGSASGGDLAAPRHLIQVRSLPVSATSMNGCAGVRTRRPKGGCYNGVACGGGGAGERATAAVTGRRGGGGAIGERSPDRSDGRESPATWPCCLAFFCSKNGIQRFSNLPKNSFL